MHNRAYLNSVACTKNALGYRYIAVRFDAATTWYAYVSGQRAVVQYSGGHWQYKDASSNFQNATADTELGALEQALDIAQNQCTATAFATLSEANLDTLGWSTAVDTIDLAIGLKADGSNIPTLDKISWNVDLASQTMTLISTAITALATPSKAIASFLATGTLTNAAAFISSATSPSYTELTGITQVATNVGGVSGLNQYLTNFVRFTGSSDKSMRFKMTAPPDQSVKVKAWSMLWQ